MPQKNIRISDEDAQWLENHPEINFSALAREALKEKKLMYEEFESDTEDSSDDSIQQSGPVSENRTL